MSIPQKAATLRIETPRVFLPLLAPKRYKGAKGGRGSGKSHFFAECLVERCLMVPGTLGVGIREFQRTTKHSSKRLIEAKIRQLGASDLFGIQESEIKTPGGGVIIFEGMQNHNADSIKSLEGFDVAWADEAQALSQRSIDLLYPTIRKAGSELWFSWNPRRKDDPIDKFLTGNADATVVEANYYDNPWFGETELKADMLRDKARDPDKYAHIWLGGTETHSEARVFKNWTTQEFETPENAVFRFGGDFGFSVDPTVLIRCFIGRWKDNDPKTGIAIADDNGKTLFLDYEAYKVGCEVDHTPSLFAGTDTQTPPRWQNPFGYSGIPGALQWQIIADSARPETISYLRRHGFTKIMGAKKGAGSVEEGVNFLKSYDIVVHPRCPHSIDEFTLYSFKTDKLTGEVIPVLEDKKNHVIDSARYAVETVRRKVATVLVGTYRGSNGR